MAKELKFDFDPAAQELFRGARENIAALCEQFMGKAMHSQSANARALRIAAENKSYDAFDRILVVSDEGTGCFPGGPFDLSLGPDWDKVQEIAQSDEHIAEAFRRHDARFAAAWEEIFSGSDGKEPEDGLIPKP